jgi:hypothetical protein
MTFGAIFTQVLGFFDRRFQVTYFLPSLLFWGVLIVIWYAGKGDVSAAAHLWTGEGTVWIVRLIAFFAWLVIFSNVLASQSSGLLRLYEGYWNFPGSGLFRRIGQQWHQRKLAQYDAQSRRDPRQYQYIYFGYPLPTQPGQVMPTQLGNILKNSELYSLDRYQLDAVVMWPRLYNLFPPSFTEAVIELRTSVDFMLVISFLSAALAFISGIYLVFVGASPYLFLLCFAGGLIVSWIAYRGAIGNALLYAQQIKVAFDLYRHELLKQMRVPLPKTAAAERATWSAVKEHIYNNSLPRWVSTD